MLFNTKKKTPSILTNDDYLIGGLPFNKTFNKIKKEINKSKSNKRSSKG
jgi:hypothetical protein